ncbi:MAG: hypothetical protein AAF581_05895 [Planctomycetota bacterium]
MLELADPTATRLEGPGSKESAIVATVAAQVKLPSSCICHSLVTAVDASSYLRHNDRMIALARYLADGFSQLVVAQPNLAPKATSELPPLGTDSTAITITFVLAIIGYVGLVTTVIVSSLKTWPRRFWRGVVAVIAAHVAMVWHYRYGWSFDLSVRNGYFGFVLFHSALLMIVASAFAPQRIAQRLVIICFGIVTLGASGAVFRYDVVAIYRAPVGMAALMGAFVLWRSWRLGKQSSSH